MIAKLQKILANPFDKLDQVQFRIEDDEVNDELLKIRKGQKCRIKITGKQTSLVDKETGEIKPSEDSIEFAAGAISISITVLEDGMIATVTVCLEDKDIVKKVLDSGLRGQNVELLFTESFL